jgi:hypothetical protein
VMKTRQPILVNEDLAAVAARYGSYALPGTTSPEWEKSALFVPLVSGEQARGAIKLSNF